MNNFFDEIIDKLKNNINLELVEILSSHGSTPRTKGAYMVVDSDGKSYGTVGGGKLEFVAIKDAKEFLIAKQNIEKEYNLTPEKEEVYNSLDMVCGGKANLKYTFLTNDKKSIDLIEDIKKQNADMVKYYIFGAGHVGTELVKVLTYLDQNVVLYDDRKEFTNPERFDCKIEIIYSDYNDIKNKTSITADDFCMVMTSGHLSDYKVVKQLLKINPYYLGCIGSRTKMNAMITELYKDGFTDADIKKIHSPIGIQVAAETPKEIAISIATELILYKAKKENRRKIIDNATILNMIEKDK